MAAEAYYALGAGAGVILGLDPRIFLYVSNVDAAAKKDSRAKPEDDSG